MQEMVITRGIPASGKSTAARVWANAAPKRVRINRDDIRFQLYGVYFGGLIDEQVVSKVQHAMIDAALKAGNSVIIDDTNLVDKFVKKLFKIGHKHGVPIRIWDFPIDLKTALERNAARERKVPEDVIRQFHDRFSNRKELDVSAPVITPYAGTPDKPDAIIVDIDGTLATMKGRSPYEWQRVGEDTVVENVKRTVNALYCEEFTVIILSGRDGECYDITRKWLEDNDIAFDHFWMRAAGDQRADNIIKAELFDNHIRDNFDVKFVIDDRDQVVEMWRAMGLQCFQVAPGDF